MFKRNFKAVILGAVMATAAITLSAAAGLLLLGFPIFLSQYALGNQTAGEGLYGVALEIGGDVLGGSIKSLIVAAGV